MPWNRRYVSWVKRERERERERRGGGGGGYKVKTAVAYQTVFNTKSTSRVRYTVLNG